MKKQEKQKIKIHIKKGDQVKVLSGNDKGKVGEVLKVDTQNYRAIVQDVNMVTKHTKPTPQNPQGGGRDEKEASIHISNLMVVEQATGEATRIGRKPNDSGKLQRYSKKTGDFI